MKEYVLAYEYQDENGQYKMTDLEADSEQELIEAYRELKKQKDIEPFCTTVNLSHINFYEI